MSRIIVAAHASFCPGVRRAVTLLEQAAAHGGEGIYCLGEIIHNRQFNDSVRQKGVRILSESELDALPADAHIFIRTHGVERQTYERLAAGGYACTDATCPYVRKIHEIVSSAGPDTAVVILGDETHPEVVGIRSFAGERAYICGSAAEAAEVLPARLAADAPAIAVAQTTFDVGEWKKFCEFFKNLYTNAKIF